MTLLPRLIYKPQHVDSDGPPDLRRVYHFQVVNTILESKARELAAVELGPIITTPWGVLYRGSIACNQTAYNQWDCDVEYLQRPSDMGTFTWSLDGSGQTEHITHGLSTVAKYPSASAPDFKGGIGFDGREFQGADVISPSSKFTVTFNHPAGVVNLTWAKFVSDLAGYVNSGPFFQWAAGEVRFIGPQFSDGSQTDAQATYNFEIERNQTGITVGTITGVVKDGWDVAWIKYKDSTDTVGGITYPVRIPEFVYVERVSSRIDFRTALGFG